MILVNGQQGLPETADSIFKVMKYLGVGNIDVALIGCGICCIPVLVAGIRKRNTF